MKKIENILAVLNPNNTMSINRPLAHAIGMSEAVVYAALIAKYSYYEQTGKLTDDGWFFSTVTDGPTSYTTPPSMARLNTKGSGPYVCWSSV